MKKPRSEVERGFLSFW